MHSALIDVDEGPAARRSAVAVPFSPDLKLIETFGRTPDGRFPRLPAHLARLARTAAVTRRPYLVFVRAGTRSLHPQLLAEVRLVIPVIRQPHMLVGLEDAFDQINFGSATVERIKNEILFWYGSDHLTDRGELKDYLRRFPELSYIVDLAARDATIHELAQPDYEKMLYTYIRKGHISVERELLSTKAAERDYSGVASSFQNILDLQEPSADDSSSFASDLHADREMLDRMLRELTTRLREPRGGEGEGR